MSAEADTSPRASPRSAAGNAWRMGRGIDGRPPSALHEISRGGAARQTTAGQDADDAEEEKILIELSAAQVDRVIRSAADGGNMTVLLSGLKDVRDVLAREPRQLEDSRLSRSLLAGLLMLASFPTDGSYLGNAEIARILDMNPSTTHRYVSTLVAVGLLERDPATRRYRLV